jgi:hypothetical protein
MQTGSKAYTQYSDTSLLAMGVIADEESRVSDAAWCRTASRTTSRTCAPVKNRHITLTARMHAPHTQYNHCANTSLLAMGVIVDEVTPVSYAAWCRTASRTTNRTCAPVKNRHITLTARMHAPHTQSLC